MPKRQKREFCTINIDAKATSEVFVCEVLKSSAKMVKPSDNDDGRNALVTPV